MRLKLKLHRFEEAPRANGGKSRWPALAWSSRDAAGVGTIHVVAPFHWLLFGWGRKVHEAEHLITFTGNEMHAGHDRHLCARSWHGLRPLARWHSSARARVAAGALRRDGDECEA